MINSINFLIPVYFFDFSLKSVEVDSDFVISDLKKASSTHSQGKEAMSDFSSAISDHPLANWLNASFTL